MGDKATKWLSVASYIVAKSVFKRSLAWLCRHRLVDHLNLRLSLLAGKHDLVLVNNTQPQLAIVHLKMYVTYLVLLQ